MSWNCGIVGVDTEELKIQATWDVCQSSKAEMEGVLDQWAVVLEHVTGLANSQKAIEEL